jgi:hypothetical protein
VRTGAGAGAATGSSCGGHDGTGGGGIAGMSGISPPRTGRATLLAACCTTKDGLLAAFGGASWLVSKGVGASKSFVVTVTAATAAAAAS